MIYDELPTSRAMTLHRRAAEALESGYAPELDQHTAELAYHFTIAAPTGTAVKASSGRLTLLVRQQLARRLGDPATLGWTLTYAWLMTITLLADVAAHPDQVKTLYELLHPYAAFVARADHIRFGSVSRYLGLLAAALSRLDEAARLLQEAVEANDRIGALPWSAHSKADLARVLLARDARGDRETAEGLFRDAAVTYQNLGMAS